MFFSSFSDLAGLEDLTNNEATSNSAGTCVTFSLIMPKPLLEIWGAVFKEGVRTVTPKVKLSGFAQAAAQLLLA